MIRSMTGYGEASSRIGGTNYFLEVKSLNSKYFKASIRLPEEFQGLEPEMEAQLRRTLTRGTITVTGKCSDTSESAAYLINHEALASYIEQVRRAPRVADGTVPFDAASLLALPGVLQPPSDEEERIRQAREAFLTLIDKASRQVIEMRIREGELLVSELLSQNDVIMDRLEHVAARAPQVVDEYQKRLKTRINALLEDAQMRVEEADLIREVAVYAEKSDIAEEITRLTGHMEQFRDMITGPANGPIGRTLDFLAQEMLREANTIASKSGDAEISRHIVEVKGAIDRIKEQVQNVE